MSAEHSDPEHSGRTAAGPRISGLLVENDRLIGWNTADMLADLGVTVLIAVSVASALDLIAHNRFDFALVDLDLARGDGLQIPKALFAADVPVILTTGVDIELPDTVHILRTLRKPYSYHDLERLFASDGPIATYRSGRH